MITKLRLVFAIAVFFFSFSVFSQQKYWSKISNEVEKQAYTKKKFSQSSPVVFRLDRESIQKELDQIQTQEANQILYFPNSKGEMQSYQLEKVTQFAEELEKKYPQIRAFKGVNTNNSNEIIWVSTSEKELQTMTLNKKKTEITFIESFKDSDYYNVFTSNMEQEDLLNFVCDTKSNNALGKSIEGLTLTPTPSSLRTFRVAISASGEYTKFHGGTVEGALSAINATLTRINGVFLRDLGIQLQLINSEEKVIFTDADTDPYGSDLNTEIQTVLNDSIGAANYDLGHLFHQGSNSGNAGYIGALCSDTKKGSGYTSGQNPEGDVFDIDYVIHEMGHQLGANHTWSYESEGSGTQVEPGSGTTIMSYAGIIAGENIIGHSSDYFHGISIYQIHKVLEKSSCGTTVTTSNFYPEVSLLNNFTIPLGTPFKLEGKAVDPNTEDVLTYAWEEIDNGVVSAAVFGPDNPIGASFRSRPPTSSSVRYFPAMNYIVANQLTLSNPVLNDSWETLSNSPRSYQFLLTVRDNSSNGGAVSQVSNEVTVASGVGPFKVTSGHLATTYDGGSAYTIQWDVANTDLKTINEKTVSVYYAQNGSNYSQTLASKVPNSGETTVILPNEATSKGRVMVAADNSIFFSINKANISINSKPFAASGSQLEAVMCQSNGVVLPFVFHIGTQPNASATLSASNVPEGVNVSATTTTLNSDGENFNVQIQASTAAKAGTYSINLQLSSNAHTQIIPIKVVVRDALVEVPSIISPSNNQQGLTSNALLQWEVDSNAAYYLVEWSNQSNFSTLSGTQTTTFNRVEPGNLAPDAIYYWRVKALSDCGSSAFSSPYAFSTQPINCLALSATDLPLTLPAEGVNNRESVISFPQDLPLSSLTVSVDITHSWVSDLEIKLKAPDGTLIPLMVLNCGSGQNIIATFNDEANPFSCSTSNPAVSGTVAPMGKLSVLKGKSLKGNWTLIVNDTADQDGGTINKFSLNACVEGLMRPDADGDGVYDDGDDLCLNTPLGVQVDTHGCPVYQLDYFHFVSKVTSQSCIGVSDGSISIVAGSTMNYNIQIQGPNGFNRTANFTSSYELNALSVGDYTYCITTTSGAITYETMCYTAHISAPEPLNVLTAVWYDSKEIELQLSGSKLYRIELNGKTSWAEGKSVKLPLEEGVNEIKVYGDLSCKGSYQESIYFSKLPVAYPNPMETYLNLNTEAYVGKEMSFKVYDMNTSELFSYEGKITSPQFFIDTHLWDSGIYVGILKINGTTVRYKLIKN